MICLRHGSEKQTQFLILSLHFLVELTTVAAEQVSEATRDFVTERTSVGW